MIKQTTPHLLIIDDDDAICKTLSAILEAEGYLTTIATTAEEAIEKTKTTFFNVALLDIKLPDMEGTKLLARLQEVAPQTVKIMITGYPSLKNAVEALNLGANSYIMKPIDPEELLQVIKNKLETQTQREKITKEQLITWIQIQALKTQSSSFEDFLDQTANELAEFGLTRTQAKIYITVTAMGIASTSEIAALSKIRREEVYRVLPELEKIGIITKKLGAPKKYTATPPETAIEFLVKNKLKAMKENIEKLEQKQDGLITKLKAVKLPTQKDDCDCSVEVIFPQQTLLKLTEVVQNAKRHLNIIAPLENLKIAYMNRPKKLMERILKTLQMQIITETRELDAFTEEIIEFSIANNNPIDLRQIEEPPYNLIIADNKEAMWSEFSPKNGNPQPFWTDDPVQIAILQNSFENLWQKATNTKTTTK